MSTRDERMVENEKRFRRANEALRGAVEPLVGDADRIPFLCECSELQCLGTVELTLEEYRQARAHPARFVLVPGHEYPAVEHIVTERDDVMLVQKD